MHSMKMDVFYVDNKIVGPTCADLVVIRSWDGTLYAETNVREIAGERVVAIASEYAIPSLPFLPDAPIHCGRGHLLWQDMERLPSAEVYDRQR